MSPGGRVSPPRTLPTTIPDLVAAINAVPRPRIVILEEGGMSDWLYRNFLPHADEVIVCDPRRNALIAKDGDKDDPIDVLKLLHLGRSGHLKKVHHAGTQSRTILKQLVAGYHQEVELRVQLANQVLGYLRQWGLVLSEKDLKDEAARSKWRSQLPRSKTVSVQLQALLKSHDLAAQQVQDLRRQIARLAKAQPMMARFQEVPGIKLVRAATLLVYLDTPFRFKSKQALWKYIGIGLVRRRSGDGPERLGVPLSCHRRLKGVILGAAKSALRTKTPNPFQAIYHRSIEHGKSPRIARRDVARALAAVLWGMWKSQSDYRPDWVGVEAHELNRRS
jgi:transposase